MTHADSIWANALQSDADSLQCRVDSLQAKLDVLQENMNFLSNVIGTANEGVNNQLSAANYLLALVGVIMTIVGIGLGVYIANRKHEVERIAKTVDMKKKAVDVIAKTTEELDKKIHSNLSALYKDLRNEETKALIDRLVYSPKEIVNLNVILMSRDIEYECYDKFRLAYLNLNKELEEFPEIPGGHDYQGEYYVLFFQHFFYKALKDEELSLDFESRYSNIFERASKRDMIKSTEDLCKALSDDKTTINKEDVLSSYLKALNNSKFSNTHELKDNLEQNLPLGLLDKAIKKCTEKSI